MKAPSVSRLLVIALALVAWVIPPASAAPNPALKGKKLLYVGASTAEDKALDEAPQRYLVSLGFTVRFADQTEPGAVADDQDVVVIGSTCQSRVVMGKFRDTRAAVVLMESFVADDMGITGLRLGVDYGEDQRNLPILLVNAPHPMQAGLPNGMLCVHKTKTPSLHWGKAMNGATVIAVIAGEPDKAAIFGYEKGALMGDNFTAPARRVVLFVNTETFPLINDKGLKLVEASLAWAVGAL
ncbi:MAG: hypothetical protein PSU94_03280 [Lacunisphaera sp.]|nr:hypothetical protein [Lacunisphaera sp.]